MKNFILQQLEFNYWANEQIISVCKNHSVSKEVISLISHIIAYQDHWYERLKKHIEFNIALWDQYTIVECSILNKRTYEKWVNLIKFKSEKALSRDTHVKTVEGIPTEQPLIEIMNNVFLHSAHHRGQVILKLKDFVEELPNLSFNNFLEEEPT